MDVEELILNLNRTDEYIEKIFKNGSCYRFFKFLKSLYPTAEPYINQEKQHVITKINNKYYDVTGIVSCEGFSKLIKEDIELVESWSFYSNNFIGLMCPECGEMVACEIK